MIEELTRIHKVLGAGLVTDDGSMLESRVGFDYDASRLGALAARLVGSTKKSLGLEKASVIVYLGRIVFFARETARGIFFVVCQKDANIGLIKIKIDKII